MTSFLKNLSLSLGLLFIVFGAQEIWLGTEPRTRIQQFPKLESPQLGASQTYLITSTFNIRHLLNSGSRWFAVQDFSLCKTGPVTLAEELFTSQNEPQPYYLRAATGIRTEVKANVAAFNAFLQTFDFRLLLKGLSPVCLLHVQQVQKVWGDQFSWVHMPVSPYAKVISLPEAYSLPNPRFIDVRSRQEFMSAAQPQTENIPYTVGRATHPNKSATLKEIDYQADRFDWTKTDSQQPLIIFAFSPSDARALRAIARLHALGEKNIYWLWGGVREFQHRPVLIPTHDKCCTMINAERARDLILKKTSLVSVGSQLFYDYSRIPNALHCKTQNLYSSNGCTDLKLNTQSPLLLYGANEASLEVFDYAQKLFMQGARQIYILRGGIGEWSASREREPEKYLLTSSWQYKNPLRNEKPSDFKHAE